MAELTICELCSKEPAAVFVLKKTGDSERKQALCLQCAEKQKIPAVQDYLKQKKKSEAAVTKCERCGELPAMVFASVSADGEEQEKQALCLFCAKEKGIRAVTEILSNLEVSDEQLRQLHAELLNQPQEQQSENFLQKLRKRFQKS